MEDTLVEHEGTVPERIGGGRSLYHVIRGHRASQRDFLSMLANNRLPRGQNARSLLRAAGVSFNETLEQARERANRNVGLGAYIAEVRFPDDGCFIEIEQTGAIGHYTVWASPDYLVHHVASVVPV